MYINYASCRIEMSERERGGEILFNRVIFATTGNHNQSDYYIKKNYNYRNIIINTRTNTFDHNFLQTIYML